MNREKFLSTQLCGNITATVNASELQSFMVMDKRKDVIIAEKNKEINELRNTLRLTQALEIIDSLHISNMNGFFKEQPTINTLRFNSRIKTVNVDKDELMLILDEVDSLRKTVAELRLSNKSLIDQRNKFDQEILKAKLGREKNNINVDMSTGVKYGERFELYA